MPKIIKENEIELNKLTTRIYFVLYREIQKWHKQEKINLIKLTYGDMSNLARRIGELCPK